MQQPHAYGHLGSSGRVTRNIYYIAMAEQVNFGNFYRLASRMNFSPSTDLSYSSSMIDRVNIRHIDFV